MWRRIGVLVGDSDPLVEYDYQRFLPPHISFHVGRLDMPRAAKLAATESLQMMCDAAPATALKVAEAKVEFFLFACTSASFFRGPSWDQAVISSIRDATGVDATTTATAVADALCALGLSRIFMVTPYPVETNTLEVGFLSARGAAVTNQFSFGCKLSREVSNLSPATIQSEILRHKQPIRDAGGLFVSCTMLRSMEIVEELEASLGVPVVTSNTASLWSIMRHIGEPTRSVRAGRLFRLPLTDLTTSTRESR